MLVVGVSESFGQRSEQPRNAGQMPNALSIPAITMWTKLQFLLESRFVLKYELEKSR